MIHPQTFLAIQEHRLSLYKGRPKELYYNNLKNMQQKAELVLDKVIEYFGTTKEAMLLRNRHEELVNPRHIAMYLVKKKTTLSDGEVAKFFKRDRTTVLHANQKIHSYLKIKNPEHIVNDIKNIELILLNQSLYEPT